MGDGARRGWRGRRWWQKKHGLTPVRSKAADYVDDVMQNKQINKFRKLQRPCARSPCVTRAGKSIRLGSHRTARRTVAFSSSSFTSASSRAGSARLRRAVLPSHGMDADAAATSPLFFFPFMGRMPLYDTRDQVQRATSALQRLLSVQCGRSLLFLSYYSRFPPAIAAPLAPLSYTEVFFALHSRPLPHCTRRPCLRFHIFK